MDHARAFDWARNFIATNGDLQRLLAKEPSDRVRMEDWLSGSIRDLIMEAVRRGETEERNRHACSTVEVRLPDGTPVVIIPRFVYRENEGMCLEAMRFGMEEARRYLGGPVGAGVIRPVVEVSEKDGHRTLVWTWGPLETKEAEGPGKNS